MTRPEQQSGGHTPGPWAVVRTGGGDGFEIRGVLGEPASRREMPGEGRLRGDAPVPLFTSVWTQFTNSEWDEMQAANARLIAAAPDLLAAAQQMSRDLEHALAVAGFHDADAVPTEAHPIRVSLRALDAAIAKAVSP